MIAQLHRQLDAQLARTTRDWLAQQLERLRADPGSRTLNLAFSLAGRKIPREPLVPEFDAAAPLPEPWFPHHWRQVDAARALMLGTVADVLPADWPPLLRGLWQTADLDEQLALARALPLLPADEAARELAGAALRTNIADVFAAVAQRNPYPAAALPEAAWNHLVLKAVFLPIALWPIVGLAERANPELSRMLADFARERRAAGRPVHPELWRPLLLAAGPEERELVRQVWADDRPGDREALAQLPPGLRGGSEG